MNMSGKKLDSNAITCYGGAITIACGAITTIMAHSLQKDPIAMISWMIIIISFIFIFMSLSINSSDCSPITQRNHGSIYDNNSLTTLLGITEEDLKRLRDNDLLGYSRYGDKYWYTQADIDRFLSRCYYTPFGK